MSQGDRAHPGHLDDMLSPPTGGPQPPPVGFEPDGATLLEHLEDLVSPSPGGATLSMGDGTVILTAGGGSAGYYRINVDQAPQAIADFRHAAEEMRNMQREAQQVATIQSPGVDAVSKNAVREMGEWAVGPDGSLRAALDNGARRLEEAARNLEDQLKAYLHVEHLNTVEPNRLEL